MDERGKEAKQVDSERRPITIVNTTDGVFSSDSRRTIRSYSQAWSRRQRKGKEKQKVCTPYPFSAPAVSRSRCCADLEDRPIQTTRSAVSNAISTTDRENSDLLSPSSSETEELSRVEQMQLSFGGGKQVFFSDSVSWGYSVGLNEDATFLDIAAAAPFSGLLTPPISPSPAAFDPFLTTPIPVDTKIGFLLCHYRNAILPMITFNKKMIDDYGSFLIPLALQNPMLLYAVLSRTSMEFNGRALPLPGEITNSGTVVNERKSNHDFLRFKHEAIRHLNTQLRNPNLGGINSATLYTVAFLLRLESLDGDLHDIRMHLSGLKRMYALGADLNSYPPSVVAIGISIVYMCCAITRGEPPFPPPVLSEEKVSQRTKDKLFDCPDAVLNLMATGFWPTADVLSCDLLELLTQRRKFVLFKELTLNGCIDPTTQELELFLSSEQMVDYHLLSLPFQTQLTPLQESVRLSLFFFYYLTLLRFEPAVMSNMLKASLQKTDLQSFWAPHFRLLLWVMFVGARGSQSKKERPWFIFHLARGLRLLAIQSLDHFRDALSHFFYLDRLFGESLVKMWEETRLAANAPDDFQQG